MGIRTRAVATVCAAAIATGCSGSSTDNSTAALKPLPATGCSLLSPAEVSSFLGTASTCRPIRSNAPAQDVVGAGWQSAHGDHGVKAGISRMSVAEDKASFEGDAAVKNNPAAKFIGDLGDDAVLVSDPRSATSGSIVILHGNDIIIVAVTHGNLTGGALEKALTATGRRLAASY